MAEIMGFLKDDATYGEREVFNRLRLNLPKDFTVYVECPLHHRRIHRYPDFIVLTNYGVLILEVKDWVQILEADSFSVKIRDRGGVDRKMKNPVTTTRDFAIALQEILSKIPELVNEHHHLEVPWGCGVVFARIQGAVLTKLRAAMGEESVLGLADLGPDIIKTRLKKIIPEGFSATLTHDQLRHIRAAINPTVLIEPEEQTAFILDEAQEKLVLEPIVETPEEEPAQKNAQMKIEIEPAVIPQAEVEQFITEDEKLAERLSVRLVRGVAGSGKSIVLIQRAKILSATYPNWKILVLTFNTALNQRLQSELKDFTNITTVNFHKLCRAMIMEFRDWKLEEGLDDWLKDHFNEFNIDKELDMMFVDEEIKWIKENGIQDKDSYLNIARKGRGRAKRVGKQQREKIYSILEKYQKYQEKEGSFDWGDVPNLLLKGIEKGQFTPEKYDAILIDEAQDFAPTWIKIITKLFNPQSTSIFIADDPTQSIYRFYSWKEKGIPVAGRTRWLRVPYRNTRQIYQAAFSIIKDNQVLQDLFTQEGELLTADIENGYMRDGDKPILHKYSSFQDECIHINSSVQVLLQQGVPAHQVAVLNPRKNNLEAIRKAIGNNEVRVDTYHQVKGLEFKAVFLSQINELFRENMDEDDLSKALRLVYMAMTRGRESLVMGYEQHLPIPLKPMLEYCVHLS